MAVVKRAINKRTVARSNGSTAVADRPANVFNETLTVDGVSAKFGNGAILVGKEWINLNDGVDLGQISKNSTYDFEIKVGTNGKRYINAIVSEGSAQEAEVVVTDSPAPAPVARRFSGSTAAKSKNDGAFRSPDEIRRSSAIGIAGGSEMYKKMLEDASDVDDAQRMLIDAAEFVLNYIENGSQV